jgi:hypothetical protein
MGSVRSGGVRGSEKMADVVRTLLLDASKSGKSFFMTSNGLVASSRVHIVTFLTYTPGQNRLDFTYVMSVRNINITLQTLAAQTPHITSSIRISSTMQHEIVTASLIFIHEIFLPYMVIVRCPRYANLFTALPISILKLKL